MLDIPEEEEELPLPDEEEEDDDDELPEEEPLEDVAVAVAVEPPLASLEEEFSSTAESAQALKRKTSAVT